MLRRVLLPPEFSVEHQRAVTQYLLRMDRLPSHLWPLVIEAFDLLQYAVIIRVDDRAYTFAQIYDELVDKRYATLFIRDLLNTEDVIRDSIPLWAYSARRISQEFTNMGLHDPIHRPKSRYLLAYCLYWWHSFCKGYAFEVEIFRDLQKTGLRFEAHDLQDPVARLSPYDLIISGFHCDIKTSTYFLQQIGRSRSVKNDCFITKVWLPDQRARILVVFLTGQMWNAIDGETLLTQLTELPEVLPQTARILHRGDELVVVDYDVWKKKMRKYQLDRGELP
ncbi:MAG: hypothetical protein GXP42_00060 [Chloroflexi bacterium]|nr:hypothetical protein [Chloroflexota bacterium]